MSGSFATLRILVEDGVLKITLARPAVRNAFDAAMCVELGAALRLAQRDERIRVVVLTGLDDAFCAGQDLRDLQARQAAAGPGGLDLGIFLHEQLNPLVLRLRTMEKPVLAGINGVAAGGGLALALACDLRIAAASATFRLAFADVGLAPDAAASLALVQCVGYARAAELCLLGGTLNAEAAERIGLVNRVVPDEQLPVAVESWARRLVALPAQALGLTKRALHHAWTATLESQLEYEAYLQSTLGRTADHREGIAAFLEKRAPRFGVPATGG